MERRKFISSTVSFAALPALNAFGNNIPPINGKKAAIIYQLKDVTIKL